MLSRIARSSAYSQRLLVQSIGRSTGRSLRDLRFSCSIPFRSFSEETTPDRKKDPEPDSAITPEGAVFSNPKIESDWVYREDKTTGRKYYINLKTNDILYNRTPDSQLATRWRRIIAGAIDGSISVFGGMLVAYLAAWELGDMNLGYSVGRIYAMLFFCGKDSILDHGTRSIGKKLMKLEIVNKHGELSGLYRNCFRNTLEMLTALTPFLGMPLFMLNGLLVMGDSLMFLLFKKRIFDFTLGTRVIPESPDHAMRVKLHKDKKLYKRQSESLEEASMSGMQQMLNQQIEYEKIRVALQEKKEAEAAAIAAAAAATTPSNTTASTPNSSTPMSEISTGSNSNSNSNSNDNSMVGTDSNSTSSVEKK